MIVDTLSEISPAAWNHIAGDENPFLRHEFLHSLETSGCLSRQRGWEPRHVALYDESELVGAVPLYRKWNSYGEYIFDWAWANAYYRAGIAYYPKFVAAVPFTPVPGTRVLVAPAADRDAVEETLIQGTLEFVKSAGGSSLHWLFTPKSTSDRLARHGFLRRVGHQFHWFNNDYEDFDAYLAAFSAAKRKKIKRERRRVHEADVQVKLRPGGDLGPQHWDTFYEFYLATIHRHGATPYLTKQFFHTLGERMGENVVMAMAEHRGQWVAGALNLRGANALFGRYWGAREDFHSLHFETCYYSAIEYCIRHRLKEFQAGAQGEHKLSRGLLPTETFSAHWLDHPEFFQAVAEFLDQERVGVGHYMRALDAHSPFRKGMR